MKTIRKYYGWFSILALICFGAIQATFYEPLADYAIPYDDKHNFEKPYEPYRDEEDMQKPANPPVKTNRKPIHYI